VAAASLPAVADDLGREPPTIRAERLADGPILSAKTHPSLGENIQGPSLIRVPSWVAAPLARYYLYFAAPKGTSIRLAYSDALLGPWKIHEPGTLQIADSYFLTEPPPAPPDEMAKLRAKWDTEKWSHDLLTEATTPHIASPDVHVDAAHKRIVMYYHGLEALGRQVTRVATSRDGLRFEARPEILGRTYFRSFEYGGYTYAMAMPGQLYRSRDGLAGFEEGPRLFEKDMRHAALLVRGKRLYVFWSRVGDAPERILVSTVALSPDWTTWKASPPAEVLRPERPWEGADAPSIPSVRSTAYGHVNQLRDPAIFEESGRVYLLYAVAGESGIAIAELHFDTSGAKPSGAAK
jgi:hypothetical protein